MGRVFEVCLSFILKYGFIISHLICRFCIDGVNFDHNYLITNRVVYNTWEVKNDEEKKTKTNTRKFLFIVDLLFMVLIYL
jgi:hypothetical protein